MRLIVEVAFTSDPLDTTPTWTDVSGYVDMVRGVEIKRGRPDESSDPQTGTLEVHLNNKDGRFTPERSSSPYYPNVTMGKQVRVRATDETNTWDRFHGFVDNWGPIGWDPTGTYAEIKMTAVDWLGNMGQDLAGIVSNEFLFPEGGGRPPVVYYPMSDPEGSLAAQDATLTTTPRPAEAIGSGVVFGTSIGYAKDGLSAVGFSATAHGNKLQVEDSNGLYGAGLWPGSGDGAWTMVCAVSSLQFPLVLTPIMKMWDQDGKSRQFGISDNIGTLYGDLIMDCVVDISTEGKTNLVAFTYNPVSDLFQLWVNGWEVGDEPKGAYADFNGPPVRLEIGGSTSGTGYGNFVGSMSHAALYDYVLPQEAMWAIHEAGTLGWVGDELDERVHRFLRYAGADLWHTPVTDSRPLDMQDPTGNTVRDVVREAVNAEPEGNLIVNRSGTIQFKSFATRANATPTVFVAGDYEADLTPVYDYFNIVNDVTVKRVSNGREFKYTDTGSVTGITRRTSTFDTYDATDTAAEARAQWEATKNSAVKTRWPQVSFDVKTQTVSKRNTLMGLDLGGTIELQGLPSTAPQTTVRLILEGVQETYTVQSAVLNFNTSPARQDYFEANDTDFGHLNQNYLAP